LSQFISLFRISYDKGIEKTGAANLELSLIRALANFDKFRVLTTRLLKEVPNVSNLFRHGQSKLHKVCVGKRDS